jgi:ATP-dependent protease ClpP protease subunit
MSTSNILNNTKSGNFVSTNKVFILDQFASNTTNELIGNLSDMVMDLQPCPQYKLSAELQSPYDIDQSKTPVIDVFINSSGGHLHILNSIATLLSIAKSRGAIIRTTVLGRASSCGSLLAILGTPGFRIMYSHAYHFIHFGSHSFTVNLESEIDNIVNHINSSAANTNDLYLKHTKLKKEELQKLQSNDTGYMNADKCLQYGLCDWIINEQGNILGR